MKKYYLITIIILILPYCAISQPMSGTYIVGGVNGVFPTPSLAVQQLHQRGMNWPVTFKIAPGTYWEKFNIHNIQGNSYQNKITIESETGRNDDVIITYDLQNTTVYDYIISIGDIVNCEINNISFEPLGIFPHCIHAQSTWTETKRLCITNCIFRNNNACGLTGNVSFTRFNIFTKYINHGIDSIIITGNTFIGCRSIAISSAISNYHPAPYALIANNIFLKNYDQVIENGMYQCDFRDNYIHTDDDGVYILQNTSSCASFDISNNVMIINGLWYRIMILHGYAVRLRNNIIVGDSLLGIISSCDSLSLIHNTLRLKEFLLHDVNQVKEMKNNILISTSGPLLRAESAIFPINSDHNLMYSPPGSPLCFFKDSILPPIPDLATWQQSGIDINSQWGLPLFSKQTDLHLQPGNTLAIGAGTPIASVTTDIDGDTRDPVNPDIGADEVVIKPVLDSVYYACKWSPFILDAGAGYTSYLWSTGATTQSITLQPSGGSETYSCTVTYGTQTGHRTTEVRWIICTDIIDQQKKPFTVKVFPNPAKESITLQTSDGNTFLEGELLIFNTQGIRCSSTSIQPGRSSININLSSLPSGLYIGRVVTRSGGGGSFRFVKQ